MATRLTDSEIESRLQDLAGWSRQGDSIEREFQFKDFAQALDFVNQIGDEAEKMDHHPDLLLHGWNKVKITLSTHSANGITDNDIELARRADLAKP